MSDYPPVPPYGASYGSQPQTNTSYLQPTYPNHYMQTQQDDGRGAQTHMAFNYDTSLSAYGYNNSLPGFSAGPLASAAPPPQPIYQGWNQDAAPLPSYSTPHSNMQYSGYSGNSYQLQLPYPPPLPQTYHQNAQHPAPYDEGELSEGEFDAYRGQHTGGTATAGYGSNYYQGNDGTSYMNPANHAVYPASQDYSNHANVYNGGMCFTNSSILATTDYLPGNNYGNSNSNYTQEPHQVESQQSDPYPPYVGADSRLQDYQQSSWMQGKNDLEASHSISNGLRPMKDKSVEHATIPVQPAPAMKSIEPGEPHHSNFLTGKPHESQSKSGTNVQITEDKKASPTPPTTQQTVQTSVIQSGLPKPVAEARKRAEKAILNLWPYEVRFPNYMEEGLDENFVGSLFDSLGFARTPKAVVSVVDTKSTGDEASSTSANNTVSERETRGILVENSGNPVNVSTALKPMAPSMPPANAVPPKTEPTEKEKNLKLKMEALRKSREERAQKAATKAKTHVPAAATTVPSEPPIVPTTTHSLTTSPLTSIEKPTAIEKTASIEKNTTLHTTSSPSTVAPVLPLKPNSPPQQPIPPSQPNPPPQPTIPGLFLASISRPAPSTPYSGGSLSNQRKRPVAADFDTSTSTMSYKRPFGQTRNESLVIDVSEEELDSEDEDEDEDVAMDLDSQADQASPDQVARKMSDQKTAALQNLPPLTNFPPRRAFTSPAGSSAASTPPVPGVSKAALGNPQVLQQKVTEIELLKKKIAEAEAAKAAKRRAQQTSSGAATPQPQPVNGNGDIAGKVEASIHMQQFIGIAKDKASSDQKKLAEIQAAELEKAAEVKRNEAERRRLRREKIATDLPRVDAEVEQSQLKLQQLRDEMARIEAAVQRSLDDKRRMAEEMERLGQEAEEQLQEQKDKLKDLTDGGTANTPHQEASSTEAELEQVAPPSPTIQNSSPDTPGREDITLPAAISMPHRPNGLKPAEGSDGVGSDQALEAALQEQVRAEVESHDQDEEGMDMDIEDSYAPEPAELVPEMSPKAFAKDDSAVTGPHIEARETPNFPIAEDDSAISETEVLVPHVQPPSAIEMEDDDYEPPEATPPIDAPSPMGSPPFSPARPESISEFEQFSHGRREDEEANARELKVNGSDPRLAEVQHSPGGFLGRSANRSVGRPR